MKGELGCWRMRNALDLEPSTLISGQNVLELPGKVCCFLSGLQRSLLASLMHKSSISVVSDPVSCTAASTVFVLTFGHQRGTLPFITGLLVWGVIKYPGKLPAFAPIPL